jgi:aspartate/methionine/tyrosine aminotransferase
VFSNRLPAILAPNRLARALADRRRAGLSIIDLTESNPTRAGFRYPDDLLTPLADRRGLTYAPEPLGLQEARLAVAGEYQRRGTIVDAERIALTASTSEAYSLLFKLLADPGDEILVPCPSYPLFELLTLLDSVTVIPYDLEYHGVWSIDFASVERAIGPRTRAVLMVSPNNPTGSFVSQTELDRLAALCLPVNAALVADEVFVDYELEPGAAARAASVLHRADVLAFSLGGLSKSIGLPQLKLGWIATAGPDKMVAEAIERLEVVCDTYLSVSTSVQLAAPTLFERGGVVREQIASRTARNYQRLKDLARATPACRVLAAAGGWYGVIQVPTLQSEEDLVLALLETDGVLVHPGFFFNFSTESFVIVSLLVPEEVFEAGVVRLLDRATR